MFVLKCPTCGELVHRVKVRTEANTQAGINALAWHAANQHLIPQIEAHLIYTASLTGSGKVTLEHLMNITSVTCPGCKQDIVEDSYLYARVGSRTRLCCSQWCLEKVTA